LIQEKPVNNDLTSVKLREEYMKPKLISFKLCPFVKRAEIALRYKAIQYEIDYIDLANPPEWFMDISPFKKVPILLVGGHVIFESTVICEYLDDAYPNKLHPDDLILRAENRSWVEFGSACLWDSFYMTVKEEKDDFCRVREDLFIKLDQVERVISNGPFFNGNKFSFVDVGFAPLFQLLEYIGELNPIKITAKRHPKILEWKKQLLELKEVKDLYPPDFKELYFEQILKRQGYLSKSLDNRKYDSSIKKRIY